MPHHYANYYWKKGRPVGLEKVDTSHPLSYKLISDPYYKWISIESYKNGKFNSVIYDSKLFDFRHLKIENQAAWQKEDLKEDSLQPRSLIRNHDDRAILIEHYTFKENLCRECCSFSPHGILISIQKLFYTVSGDSFNGVVMYDTNLHPVMRKTYAWDSKTEIFSDLLKEEWEISPPNYLKN